MNKLKCELYVGGFCPNNCPHIRSADLDSWSRIVCLKNNKQLHTTLTVYPPKLYLVDMEIEEGIIIHDEVKP